MSLYERMQSETEDTIVYFNVNPSDTLAVKQLKNTFERCVLTDKDTGEVVYDFREANKVEVPDSFLWFEAGITVEDEGVVYLVYDYNPYTGYFNFTLDLEEDCIFAQKFDYDEGWAVPNEIHTIFEYEGNDVNEWKSKEEFDKHQEIWLAFKNFVKAYQAYTVAYNNQ